jgi:endonuclease YncB( thermonuclease family)
MKFGVWLCALLLVVWGLPADARVLKGKVVAVADGDTVTLRDAQGRQHRIRLQGIDAPESRQAFGPESREQLASWVMDTTVEVAYAERDKYRRVLGKILLNGEDINLRMVRTGMAWHYKAYQSDQRWDDRWRYAWAEWRARREGVGLWADPNPTPPWTFRRENRRTSSRPAGALP